MKFIISAALLLLAKADDLPISDGKSIYADVYTDEQGVHTVNAEIGSEQSSMRLWLSTREHRMSIIKVKYDPTESNTACYLYGNDLKEVKNEKQASTTLKETSLLGYEIEDKLKVGFRDQIFYDFRSIFLGNSMSDN